MFFGGHPDNDQGDWEDEGNEGTGQASTGAKKQINTTEFYELLEVAKDATTEQIKKAFRKKALKEHPDKGGSPQKFKRLKQACDTLSDPEKRQLYDEYGEEGVQNGGPPGAGGGSFFDFFNAKQSDNRPKKMKPKLINLQITLQEVYSGCMKEVSVTRYRVCTDCDGKGGSSVQKCDACKGNGITVRMVQLGPGMYTQAQARCEKCHATGEVFSEQAKCKGCDGKRVKEQEKKLQVAIEPGVPQDHDYIFYGQSDQLPGIMAGDVYVRISLKKHEKFERRGADLLHFMEISLLEAITGVTTKITILDGREFVVATAPGQILQNKEKKTLKKLGLPFYKDNMSHGNLYFQFIVNFPCEHFSTDQEKILREAFNYSSNNAGIQKKQNSVVLQEFSEDLLNARATKGSPEDQQEEEEGGHQQGIQCQQQ